jgi:hypothetical protein
MGRRDDGLFYPFFSDANRVRVIPFFLMNDSGDEMGV